MKLIIIFFHILLFANISLAESTVLHHNGLDIEVKYDLETINKSKDIYFLYGNINITNKSNKLLKYSNKNLLLTVKGLSSRTYLDSIASNTIDFTEVAIQPNEIKSIKVYWVFKQPVNLKGMSVIIKWVK